MDSPLGPPEKMAQRREELTPMMTQYFQLCDQYDDELVLFQVGDFYEAFCVAAETVARRCEVTLTKREDSTGQYAMAGIPIDNAESYVERLLDGGYRVAIADQVEDPEETTGVVDRAVTRILTPGTLTEDELLDGDRNNFLAAVTHGDGYGLAVVDVSTGDFYATGVDTRGAIEDELGRFSPTEAILGENTTTDILPEGCIHSSYETDGFEKSRATEKVQSYLGEQTHQLGSDVERRACGALLEYAEYARGGEDNHLEYLTHLTRYDPQEYMLLDSVALRSLELFERRAVHGHENGTLGAILDETASAMGRRELDDWLRRPLLDCAEIEARHDAVGALRDDVAPREALHDELRQVYDIERLISRISRGRANARDLRSLKETLDAVPRIRESLGELSCETLKQIRDNLDSLDEIRALIDDAIPADPARELTEGGILNPSFDEDLDRLRTTEREGKDWIDGLEASERDRTGIDSLKVGHTSVHGYYIEVTDANLDSVPEDYERRQTLKNAERYYTPALKKREDEILRAEQLADEREYELFCSIRSTVAEESDRIQELAECLAELDVLVSFGTVAAEYDYNRPVVGLPPGETTEDTGLSIDGIHIDDGRHPVVERTEESFVPNSTTLGSDDRVAVITGPNMSGKSTYMRQVALIVILAQAGSFVPASVARLQIVDRVFTRVGASDDIAGGRSTFMVEMTELADILDHASSNSLVLLDEVGRGTSTADGFALAQAVTEYLHDESGALTLFATHHHELTAIAAGLEDAHNLYFRTQRGEEGVHFEHAIERGTADASYGVEVASTAGVTTEVVERARAVLESRESAPAHDKSTETNPRSERTVQSRDGTAESVEGATEHANSHGVRPSAIEARLLEADVATMTPLDAMNLLAELQRRAEQSTKSGSGPNTQHSQ